MDDLVNVLLCASVLLNGYFFFTLRKKSRTFTVDAKRLLNELTGGPALIKLEVLDASQFFLRSPRS